MSSTETKTEAVNTLTPSQLEAGEIPQLCIDGQAHLFEKDFTVWGWVWFICCFPCGIACCWHLANEKCKKCQAVLKKK